MKKTITTALVLLLTAALFAGGATEASKSAASSSKVSVNETGFPIVNEPLTLTVFGIRDANQTQWEDMLVFQEYEKMTGIHMDFQEVPDQGRDEKKSLLFASNDLPDVFYRPMFLSDEITRYGIESKQLMPLNDLIDKYCPNLKALLDSNPNYRKAITSADGNIYALPQIDTSNTGRMGFKQWINKDWLEALGLEVPTTTDELLEVLRAFKTKDPNGNGVADEIPIALRESGAVFVTLNGSFGLHHYMDICANIEDGKVHIWYKDENFRDYLKFMNQLYSEGLLWADYYKRDLPNWRANLSSAKFGVFYMPYSDVFINVEDQFTGFAPVDGGYGEPFWPDTKIGVEPLMTFALSSTCRNPEAAMRWVDYFYSEEGSLFLRYGIEGKTYMVDENGNARIMDSILNDPRGFMTALGEINCVPGGLIPSQITSATEGIVASDLTKEVAALMIESLDDVVPAPSFTSEETDELLVIRQDLNKYVDETVSRFILGEYDIDQMWDTWCKTLDKIGLAKMESIYQAAYDRQN